MFFLKEPLLCLVVPAFRVFPFSMRESWACRLRKCGVPVRVIRHREGFPENTLRNIPRNGVVVLLNDHHLNDLALALGRSADFGRGKDERLWLGIATEKVVGSIFPKSEEKTRICSQLCHLVAHFDPEAGPLISAAGARSFFCHQYVDADTFRPRLAYASKKKAVFWAGKLRVGDFTEAYRERTRLFEAIRQTAGFEWREATQRDREIKYVVREKDSYQGLLNLPSNCPGFTSNFFENLAMGGCVLQHDVPSIHPEGLEPSMHYLAYCRDQPESLAEVCGRFLRDPAKYRETARRGYEVCLARHTLAIRLVQIFTALKDCCEQNGLIENSAATDPLFRILDRLKRTQ